MIEFAPVKINLGLNITKKRPDGYHQISSIMYPIDWFDVIEVLPSPTSDTQLIVLGAEIDCEPNDNLCIKAFKLLQDDFGIPPINLILKKSTPIGAGLGGGSSDAIATLKALNRLFNLNISYDLMFKYAAKLGSDTPFFINNTPVLATGRGEILQQIDVQLKGYWILLVYPNIHISTKTAYSQVTCQTPVQSITDIIRQPINQWQGHLINDFQSPMFAMFPMLQKVYLQIQQMGSIYTSLSGSGSTIFGLFDQKPTFIQPYRCFIAQL